MAYKAGDVVTLKAVIREIDANDELLPLLVDIEGGQFPFWLPEGVVKEVVDHIEIPLIAEDDGCCGCGCGDDDEDWDDDEE